MNAPTFIQPVLTREAVIEAPRVEAGKAPVAIIRASTGADVERMDWFSGEPYIERLAITDAAVDLGYLNSGQAHLLTDHETGSTGAVLGTIARAWIKGGELLAEVRGPAPGTSPRLDETWSLVRQGILKNVSIGYRVTEFSDTREAGKAVRTATRWTPLEISLVALGADPAAVVVSARSAVNSKNKEHPMTDNAPANVAERTRASEIFKISAMHKLPPEMVSTAIDNGTPIDAFRAAVLDHLATEQERTPICNVSTRGHNETSLDNPDTALRAASVAMLRRNLGLELRGSEAAFAGVQPSGLARMYLEGRGERIGRFDSAAKLISRAYHTTSDFQLLLGAASQTVLADLIAIYSGGLPEVATTMSVPDFKSITEVAAGSFPSLEKVGEAGEIKFGTMGERGESVAIESFARAISLTFQALTNDSTGGLEQGIRNAAVAFVELKSNLLIAALGATMRDGKSVFHLDHGNIEAIGGAPSLETLSDARIAMRGQTALGSTVPLGIAPRHLIVPASLETVAQQLAASLNPATIDNANPFSGINVVVEPRLTGTAWYMAAAPAQFPALKLVNLEGFDVPVVETEAAFTELGTRFRVVWHGAAFVSDHRGLYKNVGASVSA